MIDDIMAASVSQDGRFRAVFLSVIMVLMTQVGYTNNMDFSIGLDPETESKDTGSSTSALTPSVEGAELDLGEAMTPITLNYTSQAGNATVYNGNGTAWMVKDIFAGQAAYYQGSNPGGFTVIGDTLFFNARGTSGYELWKSDGTEAGTVMVKEIEPGNNMYNGGARYLTAAGDTLYFTADDGIHGLELWKSDGTEAGTVMVKDLWPGNDSSGSPNDGFKERMTAIGDIVYFAGNDGVNGYGLYKSDGTANGTEFITSPVYQMFDLVATDDTLYFQGSSTGQTVDMALYKSDGTANGTVMLKNIACPSWTCRLTPAGDKLFFSNDDGSTGDELWISDGTVNGTVMVKDIAPTGATGGSYPFHTGTSVTPDPAVIGDTVFFKAYINGSYPYEWGLWKSDGTEAGTVLVSNMCCSSGSAPIVYGDSIFFPSDAAGGGIWRSDGTSSGTVLETNSVTTANEITGMGNTLYFSYANPDPELWAYNPTNLTLNTPPPVSWETYPALPEGMSLVNGVISGTPSVYAVNQTYTVYANQSGDTTTLDMYFSVDTNNPHTVVENQPIDPIGFHGPFQNGTTTWTVSPDLPADVVMDPNTGEITGSVNGVLAKTTYTVTATHGSSGSGGSGSTFVNNSGTVGTGGTYLGPTEIAVDSNGYKHITYGAGHSPYEINYTTDVSGSWVTTPLVQNADATSYHDIVVDSNDKIHIVWRNYSSGSLIHLTNAGGSWVNTTVDSSVGTGRVSMAIDSLDNLHISYYDSSPGYNGDLKYAHNTGGSWTKTFIDSTPNKAGEYNSITIDSNDDYHISYSVNDGGNRDVYYKSNGVKENLNNGCGKYSSVAVDSRGERYVICQESSGGLIVSSCYDTAYNCNNYPSSWTTTNITNYSGTMVVAAFDSNDYLHLAYTHNKTVYHSTNASGSWVHSVIDVPLQQEHYHNLDMVLDSNDNVHITYSDITLKTVHYMGIQASGSGSGSGGSGSGGSGSGGSGSGGSTGTGATETFTFSLESLADLDGDGLPNELPSDYDAAQAPTPGLIADTDDDADGLDDAVETDTGVYIDSSNTGTDPLDPDTDDDGICDGPNAVPPICVAGPDSAPNGDSGPPIWIGLFNKEGTSLGPYKSLPGGTYEIMPELPQSLTMDPNTGVISGTPTQTLENTTFTVWVNRSDGASLSWNFSIEILADSDGDGFPDELPDDYDPSNPTAPGLVEDLDDDNDGIPDLEEAGGLDSTSPDTDGDGICDGVISVDPICVAGPDEFPLDPSADTDTDGDGKPDTITGNSTSVPPLEEDMDDDGDGVEDVNETGTWTYNGPTDTGTNPLNPDTDYDGVCDGPVDVYHPQTGDLICVAGPDTDLGNLAFGAHYAVNGSAIEIIRPESVPTGAVWEVSPDLPADLTIDPDTGIISGTANEVTENITYTIYGNGTFSDYTSSFNLQVLEDSDRDGLPNALPDDYDNSTATPMMEDDDDDGDGLSDLAETGTGVYNGTSDYGTDPLNPDTDGDGVCDGPNSVWPICINGPDSNPFGTHDGGNIFLVENIEIDTPIPPPNQVPGAVWEISPALPAGLTLDTSTGKTTGAATEVSDNTTYTLWANVSDFGRSDSVALSVMATFGLTVLEDSDGDGMPDELPDDYDPTVGILVEDLDDDSDGLLDTEEDALGTDPNNPDSDGDGFCDGPSAPANGGCEAGPDAFPFDPSASKDTDGDGMPDTLTGTSTSIPPLVEDLDDDNDDVDDELESDCDTDPLDAESVPTLNDDGSCKDSTSAGGDNDDGFNYMWCFPCLLILLILLLIPMLIGRDRVLGMILVGPEPENTTSEPEFVGGAGTQDDPFILAPAEGVMPGESISSTEVITINRMSRIDVDMMDFNQEINGDRFSMYETNFDENGTRVIEVGEDGEIIIKVLFDDGVGEPTYEGGEFTGLLKLGRASVYLSWTVTVEPDKKKLKEIEKQRKAAEKAEQAEAKKLAKAEAEAKKKAEEEAAALLAEEEEEAAAAALLVKQEEEKAKKAEEAAAKKKADEEAAAAAKPVTKEAKKKEELKRVKANASKIDFKVLGTAKASDKDDLQIIKGIGPFIEEKLNALGIYTYLQISKMTSKLEDNVNLAIEFFPGRVKRDQWVAQAKILLGEDVKIDEKALKKAEELERVAKKAEKIDFATIGVASATDKDNLQELKGIGPFIEEKLNALGIYKFEQIAKMTSDIEDEVNIAIEFFPGRVKRDQWVKQAKERSK